MEVTEAQAKNYYNLVEKIVVKRVEALKSIDNEMGFKTDTLVIIREALLSLTKLVLRLENLSKQIIETSNYESAIISLKLVQVEQDTILLKPYKMFI